MFLKIFVASTVSPKW